MLYIQAIEFTLLLFLFTKYHGNTIKHTLNDLKTRNDMSFENIVIFQNIEHDFIHLTLCENIFELSFMNKMNMSLVFWDLETT